jgi:hypothetical protein
MTYFSLTSETFVVSPIEIYYYLAKKWVTAPENGSFFYLIIRNLALMQKKTK